MNDMMQQCCGSNGKPDFDMMKQYMERCGKEAFSDEQIGMMKGFCGQEGTPDKTKMMEFMKKCGCRPS
jgi:hypothetical protein